jgi:hypothetical protein
MVKKGKIGPSVPELHGLMPASAFLADLANNRYID